ncbi:MAG: hypothetical protein KDA96_04700 [Planctomycetaceae bacterium]|nr:hypothetical protein [Planctomycetaceae bacterium]
MVIWGLKADGSHGVMTVQDVEAFVVAKAGDGGKAWRANVRAAAGYIMGHNGVGDGSDLRHNSKVVRHSTHGAGASHVTVFFTTQGGEVASIIGVGSHRNAGGAVYDLDWHTQGWKTGNVVNL